MDFTKKEIQEYKNIFDKYFNATISDDEAKSRLNVLVRQMAAIYKPITTKQYEEYKNKHGQLKQMVEVQ